MATEEEVRRVANRLRAVHEDDDRDETEGWYLTLAEAATTALRAMDREKVGKEVEEILKDVAADPWCRP